jgi:hypothetical protein
MNAITLSVAVDLVSAFRSIRASESTGLARRNHGGLP